MRASGDPMLLDLGARDVINVRCHCGRAVQIAPFRLIGRYGITQQTRIWSLSDRFRCEKCRRRPPQHVWIAKWQD